MALKKLLNKGTVYKRNDGYWGGAVRYLDETGKVCRKGFSGVTKKAILKKISDYIIVFKKEIAEADFTHQALEKVMRKWLEIFCFPSVERSTYDSRENAARLYIYPVLGDKIIAEITADDLNGLLAKMMYEGYAHSSVKRVYIILNQFFHYLYQEEWIPNNPMARVRMIKKSNFLAAQGKDDVPLSDSITVLTEEEIERIKRKVPYHNQASVYILMLNTGLRKCEVLGLLNSDIDLANRVMHINRAVKEVSKRDRSLAVNGKEMIIGNLKTSASKRTVPLNKTAIEMIKALRMERYFG